MTGGTALLATWVLALGTVLKLHRDATTPTDWSEFDVLGGPAPEAPAPTYPGGRITRSEPPSTGRMVVGPEVPS